MKKTISIIIALFIAITFTPFFNGEVNAAFASNPYNVQIKSIGKKTVTFKWAGKSAKGWVVKYKAGKKYKTARTKKNAFRVRVKKAKKTIVKFRVKRKGGKYSYMVTGVTKSYKDPKKNIWKLTYDDGGATIYNSFDIGMMSNKTKKVKLSAKMNPSYAKKTISKKLVWTSSNKRVATISNGVIKSKTPGKATIRARAHSGKYFDFKVTVINPKPIAVNNIKKITKPGVYTFTNPYTGEKETVAITKIERELIISDSGEKKYGKVAAIIGLKNGGSYILSVDSPSYSWYYKESNKAFHPEFDCYGCQAKEAGDAYYTKPNEKDVEIKWTCNGTDPAKVTKDVYGHCEYTLRTLVSYPKEWSDEKMMEEGYTKDVKGRWCEYVDTTLCGITKYGQSKTVFDNNPKYYSFFRIKVYKKGKLIYEDYTKRLR